MQTSYREELPNRIRELRLSKGALGWTQERLAYRSGVAVATISRLERGERNASTLVAHRIAKALGSSVAEVFPDPERAA